MGHKKFFPSENQKYTPVIERVMTTKFVLDSRRQITTNVFYHKEP